jgi:DNA-directed RNA polymerase specialized sigma24 family protein
MPPTGETVIVTALRSGNVRRAVELMLDIYQDEVFGYCARLCGIREALRVYQMVLASALDALSTLEERITVRAFLFQIARAAVLHHQRSTPILFPSAHTPSHAPIAGPEDAPGIQLRDEVIERWQILLDPSTIEILQLALWQGLHPAEVALVVGRSELEVRRKASAGLALLDLEISRQRGGSPS